MTKLLKTIGRILFTGESEGFDDNESFNGDLDDDAIDVETLLNEDSSHDGSNETWTEENNNLYAEDKSDKSHVPFNGRKRGECNWCDCLCYIPKPGTTECICGHSKHSHIGL